MSSHVPSLTERQVFPWQEGEPRFYVYSTRIRFHSSPHWVIDRTRACDQSVLLVFATREEAERTCRILNELEGLPNDFPSWGEPAEQLYRKTQRGKKGG